MPGELKRPVHRAEQIAADGAGVDRVVEPGGERSDSAVAAGPVEPAGRPGKQISQICTWAATRYRSRRPTQIGGSVRGAVVITDHAA